MTTFADVSRLLSGDSDSATSIDGVSSSSAPKEHTLSFIVHWDSDASEVVRRNPLTMFVVPADAPGTQEHTNVVAVPNPRLGYGLAVRELVQRSPAPSIAETAIISATAEIGDGVSVGHYAVIEDGVSVGDGTFIDSHVVLKSGVHVGRSCRIGSHSAIGGPGFGFELDEHGLPVRIGHLGGVVVGNDVEIGQHVAIAQGTIDPTRVADHVKIDDCVFIAHNVSVGEASFIIAGAEISGSVTIGRHVWISPEATVTNKVRIGDHALVGIGAVVVRDVEENTVVAGVPAKPRGLRHEGGAPAMLDA